MTIMSELDLKTVLEISGVAVNVFVLFMNSKIRADISELKIWVLENFERRKEVAAKIA